MTQSVDEAIQSFKPLLPLSIALSGGADSTALLLACSEKWPGQVEAIHVNHGLQAAAIGFEQHCRKLCDRLKIELTIAGVDGRAAKGQSPEEAARDARYKAFSAWALMERARPAIKSIALAQHADDQVETLLLAMGRGAGLAGMSSMAAHWQREGIQYFRPFLQVSAAEIRRWLAVRAEEWVEDPTNQDGRFARNRIRARLMPALKEVFPHGLDTFARAAAQAQTVLDEVAAQDLEQVLRPRDSLPLIREVQNLSRARQTNALRHWLKHAFRVIPSTAQLNELQHQIDTCQSRGHQIHIKVGNGFIQRQGEVLTWYNPAVLLLKI
jgi:tRNA(Ile)-lysidine synthase